MSLQHGRYDSPAKLSTKRSASCLSDDEDVPAQVRTRELRVDTSSPVLHQFEQSLPIPPTHLIPTVPEEIETPNLGTPDPLTPDVATPDKSIWATFLASLGLRSLAGSVNKSNENHKDRHRPEPKDEEEKTVEEFNGKMALVRDNKTPLCRYGTHRRLNQLGDDVKNKVCKFHRKKLTEETMWLECE